MGYQDVDVYKLTFEGRDGLEVSVEGLNTGELLDLMDSVAVLGNDPAAAKLDGSSRPVIEKLIGTLGGSLIEWNVEDRNGDPVPATADGLKSLKLGLVMDIITAWIGVQTGPGEELGKDSPATGTSGQEQSIPMEPLSPNPGS